MVSGLDSEIDIALVALRPSRARLNGENQTSSLGIGCVLKNALNSDSEMGVNSFGKPCLFALLLIWFWLPLCSGAPPIVLEIGKAGAYLYSTNDLEGERVYSLEPGEQVTQIVQTVGRGVWYLVKTRDGRIGWLRSSDVESILRQEPSVRMDGTVIRFGPGSTWSARTRSGSVLSGTWSGVADRSAATARGSWTVRDKTGRIRLRGTWSASKHEHAWQGRWRALVAGETRERSGTWSCNVQLPPDASLAEMLGKALLETISGEWQSGGQSGSWSIRAVP